MSTSASVGTSRHEANVWNHWYEGPDPPPWEIDRPQSALAELAAAGALQGRVLDLGCGSAEHAILAAEHGAAVVGIDISPLAITRATEKARERGVEARFVIGDALRLDLLDEVFDVVIDSGMFQAFDADKRSLYASSLANVVAPGGVVYITCVSDREPGDDGPRRVSEAEIRTTFAKGWVIEELRECWRERRPEGESRAKALLATIRRVSPDQAGSPLAEDRLARVRAETRRLYLENDLLELDGIRRKLELARENGLSADELAPMARRLIEQVGSVRP